MPHNLLPKSWIPKFNAQPPFSAIFAVVVKVESLGFRVFMAAVKLKEPSFFSRLLVHESYKLIKTI